MSIENLDPIFEWATDTLDAVGNPTKAIPPTEQQQTGLVVGEPWPRLWHNHAMNNFSEYLKHLVVEPTGTVRMTDGTGTAPTDITEAATQWGGTWTLDTTTVSGYNLFTKTAL